MRIVSGVVLIGFVSVAFGAQREPRMGAIKNRTAEAQVRQLIDSLPVQSMWRKMLEQGARGDGMCRPWMDEMRKEGVRIAVLTFEFDWVHGGEGLENLKDWKLVSAKYFTDYDYLNLQPITDKSQLKAIGVSGLDSELEGVGLDRAKAGIWIEDPGHQHPSRDTGTGFQQVFLADNEWLPVQMFPWFAAYGSGTTPLMHAAILGDVARIKCLLAQGADVDAVSTDGSTALIYATESSNPEAVQSLLAAGALPNATTNDGSTALMTASAGGDLRSVSLLLNAGADPNSRDANGQTALSIATQRNQLEVVRLLKLAGAGKQTR